MGGNAPFDRLLLVCIGILLVCAVALSVYVTGHLLGFYDLPTQSCQVVRA